MKHNEIKDVFEEHLKHISYDKELYSALQRFRIKWTQKSDMYVDFLGGNLTGVHPIRFSDADENLFYTNVVKCDLPSLRYDLYKVPGIDKTRATTSNPTYLTIFWLMHMFTKNENKISQYPNDVIEAYYVFAYKVISSLITHYFIYNVDIATAKAVYERLSNRYLIKRFGTWQKVFDHRAKDVILGGLHYDRVKRGTTEDAVRAIADMQGRIREAIKNIYTVLIDVNKKNEKVYSSSVLEEDDEGGMGSKAVTSSHESYVHYVRDTYSRPNDFINNDLVYLIKHVMPNIPEEHFVTTLRYLSEKIPVESSTKNDFIGIGIITSISYLRQCGIVDEYNKQVLDCLNRMKGFWSSSSVKSPEVKYIKNYLFNIAQSATGVKTKWMITTITIGILLYVFLRSMYKNKS